MARTETPSTKQRTEHEPSLGGIHSSSHLRKSLFVQLTRFPSDAVLVAATSAPIMLTIATFEWPVTATSAMI